MILSASGLCSMNQICMLVLIRSVRNSWMYLLLIAFLVWFSYEVCVENELVTRIRLSCISPNVSFASFAVYLPRVLISLSKAATIAFLTALSGEPPCSRCDELWKYLISCVILLKQKAISAFTEYSSLSARSLPLPSPENWKGVVIASS